MNGFKKSRWTLAISGNTVYRRSFAPIWFVLDLLLLVGYLSLILGRRRSRCWYFDILLITLFFLSLLIVGQISTICCHIDFLVLIVGSDLLIILIAGSGLRRFSPVWRACMWGFGTVAACLLLLYQAWFFLLSLWVSFLFCLFGVAQVLLLPLRVGTLLFLSLQ